MRPTVQYSSQDSSQPQSAAIADFNNDGHMDLAVANYGTDNIGIFRGFGDDAFTNQTIHDTASNSRPYSIAISDLDMCKQMHRQNHS